MAKKKGASASPFVPVDEQPYSIPENWCWTRLSTLVETSKEKTDDFSDDSIKYVGLEHMEKDGGIIGYSPATEVKSLKSVFHVGQILYGKLRPYLNKHDIAGFEGVCSTDILVFDARDCANSRYVNYFLNQRDFIEYAVSNSKGINLPRVSELIIMDAICPLPPLSEQQRIVTLIESLFAKLDEAKEKAQAVVDGFELRKSAILHKAFTGELTEQWRKEHGIELDSWGTKRIYEITKPRAGYAFDSKKFTNSGYQIIRMGNLYGGELDLSRNPVFISPNDVDETALKRSLVNNGDILITLTGTKYKRDYGYAVSIINPINLLVNQRILCLTPSQDVERNYILYYLRSNIFRDTFFSNETGGVNQGNVSSKFVENIEIKVPLYAEQHEIVTILDRIMVKEQQAKEAAEAVLDQIDTMKKAILARAFRGELGTNDPAEEWAGEMICQRSNYSN